AALPEGAVHVKVQLGWVTLSGEVRWHFQRMAAEHAVKKLGGVVVVSNLLTIVSLPQVAYIKDRIELSLRRNAEIEADAIK
ncbi:BON domain-containing protein, partial [Rhizobium ruizarguesonis]